MNLTELKIKVVLKIGRVSIDSGFWDAWVYAVEIEGMSYFEFLDKHPNVGRHTLQMVIESSLKKQFKLKEMRVMLHCCGTDVYVCHTTLGFAKPPKLENNNFYDAEVYLQNLFRNLN